MRQESRILGYLALILIMFLGQACTSREEEEQLERHREAASQFVLTSGNYDKTNIDTILEEARAMLSPEAKKQFFDTFLESERTAVRASGRTQKMLIHRDGVETESLEPGLSFVHIPAERVRIVEGKESSPLQITYSIEVKDGPKKAAPQIVSVVRQINHGQDKALSEERLLEQLREVSDAAAEERKQFLLTVGAVRKDLKEHEKKVENDFKKLSQSMEKLGSTVSKLGADVRKRNEKRDANSVPPTQSGKMDDESSQSK